MSRSKRTSNRKRTSSASVEIRPDRRRRFWLLTIGAVVLMGATVYRVIESPHAYYERARKRLSQNPSQCEQLAEQAVMKAGGDYPEAQLLQCQALAALGQWDAALGGFSLIKDTSSCAPEALVNLAAKALDADQLQLADRALKAARRPGPSFADATELLVRLKLKLQLPADALALCREWQSSAPDTALPWVVSAGMETSRFELGTAIADYQEALRHSPPRELESSIRASLANLLVHTGDVAAARAQFDKLLEYGPVEEKGQLDYVQLLRLEGRFDDALVEVERYLANVGTSSEALKRRGMIRMDLEQWDEALEDLKAAAVGNEFDIGTHHLLAQIYLRRNEPDLAQPHLEKSRRLTDATFRISELDDLLRTDPSNAEWTHEQKSLQKILGR
ncbi:MAG TPA: hypothetical protein PLY87_13995 [Planctomycetaceae bacterium]|nr:hypothetical protein [Planctomycetaceae bacterium]